MHKSFHIAAYSIAVAGLSLCFSGDTQAQGDNVFPSNGNVGIGRTNPAAKLHVKKNANTLALEGVDHTYMEFYPRGLNSGRKGWFGYEATYNNALILKNEIANGPILLRTNGGSVGIGTNIPDGGLHVSKNGNTFNLEGTDHTFMALYPNGYFNGRKAWLGYGSPTTKDLTIENEFAAGDILLRTSRGNVGINTTSPQRSLHVAGNGSVMALEGEEHAFISWFPRGYGAGRRAWIGFGNGGSNDFTIRTDNEYSHILLNPGPNGKVGIGTNDPAFMLDICGTARAKELIVEIGWCDYVFDPSYELMPLSEVEAYIEANKHLPNIPSAAEVESQGLKVAEMNARMMEKIEELTLYIIEQNKRIEALQTEVQTLKND